MATAIRPRDKAVAQSVKVDASYRDCYGTDLNTWPNGALAAYFETLSSHDTETLPIHPRRVSASRRHRNQNRLAYRIHELAPGAASVLMMPMPIDDADRVMVTVRVLTGAGLPVRLPLGGSHRLVELIQAAYPVADWSRAQTWHADNNRLTTWGPTARDFRASTEAGHVETLGADSIRLAAREARDA
ncbi:hypothetical protein [Streptomyces sp. NPDC055243]|uniref:hypothetical protein n=1 Tax=Streptomyces sp. NPDC055243 TaxID=3365720 RepID=UPI0037D0F00D